MEKSKALVRYKIAQDRILAKSLKLKDIKRARKQFLIKALGTEVIPLLGKASIPFLAIMTTELFYRCLKQEALSYGNKLSKLFMSYNDIDTQILELYMSLSGLSLNFYKK